MRIRNFKLFNSICITLLLILSISTASASGIETDKSTQDYYTFDFNTYNLGKYQITLTAYELPKYETLPTNIVTSLEDKFKSSSLVLTTEVDNLRPSAVYSSRQLNKVDVIFAVGEFDQFEEFQGSLAMFVKQLIDPRNFIDAKVEQVETSNITAEVRFPWEVYNLYRTGLGTGDGQFNAVGQDYLYRGYGSEAPIDFLYYDDGLSGERTFKFDIDMTGYNSCATVIPGFMFGCYMEENSFNGYIALMWHKVIGIYKFTSPNGKQQLATDGVGNIATSYACGDYNSYNISFKLLKTATPVSTSLQKKMTFKYIGGNLIIIDSSYGTDVEILNYECKSPGNGYGVAAANSGHGCGARSYTKFRNFSLETKSLKALADAISDISWRDNSLRVIIHITDIIPEDLKEDQSSYTACIAQLLANDNYLINLGTDVNKSILEKIGDAIKSSDGEDRSVFINNNCRNPEYNSNISDKTISDSLLEAIDWIVAHTSIPEQEAMWLLVNDQVHWNTQYNDSEHDLPLNYGEHDGTHKQPQDKSDLSLVPTYTLSSNYTYQDAKILAERWRFRHFEDFFDNDTGKVNYHNIWIDEPVDIFDKTGKYRVNYQRKDNPFYEDSSLSNVFDNYRYWSNNYEDVETTIN